jgi:hypothetical protein
LDVPCRHCQIGNPNRPRGLCWRCYYTPGVRDLYPSSSKFARRGLPDIQDGHCLAMEPTPHPPGSPEKVLVLQERARLGVSLFHPDDAEGARHWQEKARGHWGDAGENRMEYREPQEYHYTASDGLGRRLAFLREMDRWSWL